MFLEVLRGADGGMPVDAFDTDWSVSLTDNVGVAVPIFLHLVETTEEIRVGGPLRLTGENADAPVTRLRDRPRLNNLLTVMIGFCDLLLKHSQPGE